MHSAMTWSCVSALSAAWRSQTVYQNNPAGVTALMQLLKHNMVQLIKQNVWMNISRLLLLDALAWNQSFNWLHFSKSCWNHFRMIIPVENSVLYDRCECFVVSRTLIYILFILILLTYNSVYLKEKNTLKKIETRQQLISVSLSYVETSQRVIKSIT